MGKRRFVTGLVGVGCLVGLAGLSAVPAQASELPFERLSGPSGVETSLAVAKHVWGTTWPVVYVASTRNPVDALPAATIGDGPVVLTDGKTLNLGGVKPGKVVLLGGVGAVPQAVEAQAKSTGAEVIRLAGADRNETAQRIAERWVEVNGNPSNVYVTKNAGTGSPDAVAASVLRDGPILTFTNDSNAAGLAAVIAKLDPQKVTALGGVGPVSDANLTAAAAGKATARLAGANRYETAFEIAKVAKAQNGGSVVYLASGTALKDAMVAGAAKDGVILLTPANGAGVKAQADALGATKITAIGGTGVLPEATVKAAATGIIPVKSAKDMTMDEMRANLTKVDMNKFLTNSKLDNFVFFKAPKPSPKGDYLVQANKYGGHVFIQFPDWEDTGLTANDFKDGQCLPNHTSVQWSLSSNGCNNYRYFTLNMPNPEFGALAQGMTFNTLYFKGVCTFLAGGDPSCPELWHKDPLWADSHYERLNEGEYVEIVDPVWNNYPTICGAAGGTVKCMVDHGYDSTPGNPNPQGVESLWFSYE